MFKKAATLGLIALNALFFTPIASADGVGNTTWNLRGEVGGRVGVSCKVGVRNVGASVTTKKFFKSNDTNGDRKLNARIAFDAGITDLNGIITGAFSWTNDEMSALGSLGSLTGTWRQEGNALFLHFDNWAASPIAVAATAMTQGFAGIAGQTFTQGAATLSVSDTNSFGDNVKYVFHGRVNPDGTSLKITEVFGFGFTATASAYGQSNTCSFRINNFGRVYKGTPELAK